MASAIEVKMRPKNMGMGYGDFQEQAAGGLGLGAKQAAEETEEEGAKETAEADKPKGKMWKKKHAAKRKVCPLSLWDHVCCNSVVNATLESSSMELHCLEGLWKFVNNSAAQVVYKTAEQLLDELAEAPAEERQTVIDMRGPQVFT